MPPGAQQHHTGDVTELLLVPNWSWGSSTRHWAAQSWQMGPGAFGVPAMWLHIYIPISPSLQCFSPIPGILAWFGPKF